MNKLLTYQMRGGTHPDPRTEAIESSIEEMAIQAFLSNPTFMKKGLKWTYNWLHFASLYSTRNPALLNYLFDVRPYPDYIEVETSTHCNLKCKMCEHTYWNEKNQNMTLDEFKIILNQFPRLKWIGLTGIGESYLNPDFEDMMRLCKSRGIYIENFDNFVLLNEEKARNLVEMGVDKIYVSLDAATKETYEKGREGANWEKVIENVKTLDRVKKEKNAYSPELWFHFIVSNDNKHEMESYLDMINELKVNVTRVQYTIILHPYKEIKELGTVSVSDEEKQKILEKAKSLGIQASFNVNTQCKGKLNECSVWYMPFIFVDGTVIPCCSQNEQNDRPWQRETSMGNIFEKPFREIWKGDRFTELIKNLKDNISCPACDRCILFEK